MPSVPAKRRGDKPAVRPAQTAEDIEEGKRIAHWLADKGVPVGTGRLDPNGNPDTTDQRWKGWQRTAAGSRSHRNIDAAKPGDGVFAVCGVVNDVLDPDLYKEGAKENFVRLIEELGDDGPDVYFRQRTPHDGLHLFVPPLGIGSHNGFLPGIDLKGGMEDGSSRGFVFIPPTVRFGKPYAAVPGSGLRSWNGHDTTAKTREVIQRCLAAGGKELNGGGAAGRLSLDEYRRAVLAAGDGGQRQELLRYVRELHRQGKTRDAIIEHMRGFLPEVQNFPSKLGSWYPARGGDPDKWIKQLLIPQHARVAKGAMPDAEPGELDGITGPVRPGISLTSSYQDDDDSMLSWLWEAYLAFGLLTQWDGEKGQGKSLVIADLVARATTGRGMPFAPEVMCGPIDVILFAEDDNVQMRKRLKAAGADLSRIHHPHEDWVAAVRREKKRALAAATKGRRGAPVQVQDEETSLLLPYGSEYIARMIGESGSRLAVFDPITDYLHERVSTNNDAAVRRALDPLARALAKRDVAALATRHMNKDTRQAAKYRGGGTMAFQNRARVHLISGELEKTDYAGAGVYGLTMIANNYMPLVSETLCYSIVDSSVPLDTSGNMVGRVEWHETAEISADVLTGGDRGRRGPDAYVERDAIEIVRALFADAGTDRLPARDCEDALEAAGIGIRQDSDLEKRVKKALMIESEARKGARFQEHGRGWDWVLLSSAGPKRPHRRRG